MHTIELKNGSRLAYRDHGEGPVMLLVHGWGVSGELFAGQIAGLSDRFRLIVPDLPGHGASGDLEEDASFAQLADALAELIERLELRAICLVGWSLGAMVSWDLLRRHPDLDIRGLVTIDMVPRLLNDSHWLYGLREGQDFHAFDRDIELILSDWSAYADLLAPRWLGVRSGNELPEQLQQVRSSARGNRPESMAQIWKLLVEQDQRSTLPRIAQPALVIMGGQSSLYEVPAGSWIVSQMPHARLEVFPESGHAPNLDQPAKFNQVLADFASTTNTQSAVKSGINKT